jgi:hypothetical protein
MDQTLMQIDQVVIRAALVITACTLFYRAVSIMLAIAYGQYVEGRIRKQAAKIEGVSKALRKILPHELQAKDHKIAETSEAGQSVSQWGLGSQPCRVCGKMGYEVSYAGEVVCCNCGLPWNAE